jgi:two-component system, OmpR family, KDP operon response regulator KdpE
LTGFCRSVFWDILFLSENMPPNRVLIVDDESALRHVLSVSLATVGFEAEEAGTGEQALALLGAAHYDVVLLDINMPGKGGIETCREIQRLSPRPLVFMLTVRDGAEDKAQAFAAGADGYLTKPFHLSALVASIRAALGSLRGPEDSLGTSGSSLLTVIESNT